MIWGQSYELVSTNANLKQALFAFCVHLFNKIFTFEKTNLLVFFSLTQIFSTFASKFSKDNPLKI